MNDIILTRVQLASSDVPDIYSQVTYPKLIQRKYDGVACLAVNGVAMSRTMKPIPNRFIQAYFAEHQLHGFHGELMVNGNFNEVQSGVMRESGEPDFYYVVYDLWNSKLDYSTRYNILEDSVVLSEKTDRLRLVLNHIVDTPEDAAYYLEQFVQEGYEGAMLRDAKSFYKQGRHTLKSQALMKLKRFEDDEAEIIGYEEKMTNTNAKELNELGYSKRSSKKEGLIPAGTLGALVVRWGKEEFSIGSGYNDAQRKALWEIRDDLIGQLVKFKFQGVSAYNVCRFPIFLSLRDRLDV